MSISIFRTGVVFTFLAFWPVWQYIVQFSVKSFDYSLFILMFLFGYFVYEQMKVKGARTGSSLFLFLSWLLVIFYILLNSRLPSLANAIVAMGAVACASLACFPREMVKNRGAYLILFPLALPLGATIQFVIGYPLRRVTSVMAGFILGPYDVTIRGTTLFYGSKALEIDVPCSGVSGLWAFLLAAGIFGLIFKYSTLKLGFAVLVSLCFALFYNVLRTCVLFMGKVYFGEESEFVHNMIGTASFLIAFILFLQINHVFHRLSKARWRTQR